MSKKRSDTPIEDIFEKAIRKASNKASNLRKKLKSANDGAREKSLRDKISHYKAIAKKEKIKLAAYKKLLDKSAKEKTKAIEIGNQKSKLNTIRAREISAGLPSLGKKR